MMKKGNFDINVQDEFGSTLYHVTAQEKWSFQPFAMKILLENAANPLIKDNRGMVAGGARASSDRRKRLLQRAMHDYKQNQLQNVNDLKPLRKLVRTAIQEWSISSASSSHSELTLPGTPETRVTSAVETPVLHTADLLTKDGTMTSTSQTKEQSCNEPLKDKEQSCNEPLRDKEQSCKKPLRDKEQSCNEPLRDKEQSCKEPLRDKEQSCNEPLRDTDSENETKEATSPISSFDDLYTLEVKCSAEVQDTLHATNILDSTKQQIVQKIQYLAQGLRGKKLSKKLHLPKSHAGIHLFEARVTQAQRIIWQKATEFSSRHKNKMQVIRIWKIVFQHDHVDREVKKIVRSLKEPSVALKNIWKRQTSGNSTNKEDSIQQQNSKIRLPVESSANETCHSLKKFYSMTSYMIRNMLSGIQDVDYPFEVTELEHEIINLKPSPECSIILLGRSGTGKTTCCLYRLWNEYHVCRQNVQAHIASQTSALTHKLDDQACSVSTTDSSQAACSEVQENEVSEKSEDEVGGCEQLHQIFISRNNILCGEIAKMFHSLRNAHYTPKNDLPASPLRFQDAREDSWPLFLSVLQWLMMLDASLPGETFFPRDNYGRLRCSIRGMDDEIRVSLNSCLTDKADEETTVVKKRKKGKKRKEKGKKKKVPEANNELVYTMVTYEVFTSTLWPKMVPHDTKKQPTLHPTLVWTEIMSFIKGSADALESGELNLEEYQNVGKKMAPNFRSNREDIYELYRKYKDLKKSRLMFDECDLVHNVYKRLQHAPQLPVDQFYVDEAQDLTQAELFLLIHCCRDSNGLFFSGDTAQSIMKGVSFRFADLKSLFYRESLQRTVSVPNQIYHLTCNYRSHSGIVDLASSVVGLLQHFFPMSFDRLAKEQGLFPGPKPVLIDSSNFAYLAKLLKGQKRESTPIELGAQQVVLVASEKARDSVPEELREGLVMTVYEAKGLEFDDVLIFNFFKEFEVRSV